MKVALYCSHHSLPFWHSPKNPYMLFDPTAIEDWTFDSRGNVLPAEQHSVMPILKGLLALDLPGVMAHVSIIFDPHENTVEYSKRCWVQITTEPEEFDNDDLPVVVRAKEVLVTHLWGGDNGTYTPYQLLSKEKVTGEDTPEFWTEWFIAQLRQAKAIAHQSAEEDIREAQATIKAYSLIPDESST